MNSDPNKKKRKKWGKRNEIKMKNRVEMNMEKLERVILCRRVEGEKGVGLCFYFSFFS